MPNYASPGVYVEEVPSAVKAIAGVGTSTAGFIGVIAQGTMPQPLSAVTDERIGTGTATGATEFALKYPVVTASVHVKVKGADLPAGTTATATNDDTARTSKVTLSTAPANGDAVTASYIPQFIAAPAGEPKLVTNFGEFKKFFGDFHGVDDHNHLAHAVYGFFNNGGTRCWVMRLAASGDLANALLAFEAIDEIAIVAAPGFVDGTSRDAITTHCRVKTQDRFAIFDSKAEVTAVDAASLDPPPNSDYAAFYFPWIQVFDPVEKKDNPAGDGLIFVPPSGHLAGVYARVDTERGVHKAPGNEVIMGALGLKYRVSKAQQDGLNPSGVNCIRDLNGNIRVWGARTAGGEANADLKYINVRRTLLFLRESIDEGTQWVVFEPNTPALWQKITRNVTAFLTNVWRSGALFGNTVQEAFYVKCDAETNPPELRELGQVVTEIGVAIVRPAEFVIFRISQWQPPAK